MSTSVNLTDNDFAILGIKQQFEQDEQMLQQRWKDLQAQMHPDRFASQGEAAQRAATQWSVRINEAYQRLKNPVARAALLCELAGVAINSETNTSMPAAFLMQQLEWREQLEAARTVSQVDQLQGIVDAEYARSLSTLAWLIDEKGDYPQAAQQVRVLMFMDRFMKNINDKLDQLDV